MPSVDAEPEPEPEPAAEPPVPTLELLVPPPAEVPPVPSVEAEPLPDPPADEPPVPTLELLMPPPADVPPVPTVELDCATASAVPASNAAAAAEIFRSFIGGLLFRFFSSAKNYALSKEDDLRNVPAHDVAFSIFVGRRIALSNVQKGTGICCCKATSSNVAEYGTQRFVHCKKAARARHRTAFFATAGSSSGSAAMLQGCNRDD